MPAIAESSTPTPCPVKPLAVELETLQRAWHALERLEGPYRKYSRVREAMELIDARIRALEDTISWQRASSVEGAICQIQLASSISDLLRNSVYEERSFDGDHEKIERLLFSAVHALGCDFSTELAQTYMSRECDRVADLNRICAAAVR